MRRDTAWTSARNLQFAARGNGDAGVTESRREPAGFAQGRGGFGCGMFQAIETEAVSSGGKGEDFRLEKAQKNFVREVRERLAGNFDPLRGSPQREGRARRRGSV